MLCGAVHDRAVLHRGSRPDRDGPVVAAQHRARPYRRLWPQRDPPDHNRVGVNVGGWIDVGRVLVESVDRHAERVSLTAMADGTQGSETDPIIDELLAAAISGIGGAERPGQTLMARRVWDAMDSGT